MRNNIQNDVKIESAKIPASKFDLSGSYSSTASVGEVGVSFLRTLLPGSKAMCGSEQLIYLAPMVAPAYTKQHYKTWHMFVPLEDVWPNYSAFATYQKISRNGQIFAPNEVPNYPKDLLSLWCLTGAKCTLYLKKLDDNATAQTIDVGDISGGYCDVPASLRGTNNMYYRVMQNALSGIYTTRADGTPVINVGALVQCSKVTGPNGSSRDFFVESGNYDDSTFYREDHDYGQSDWFGYDMTTAVKMDTADACLYRFLSRNNEVDHNFIVCFAFRFSSWGIHLFKILRGLGYSMDFDARDEQRSILPLLACYKAYWDIFGLNLYQNFETTYCGRLITALSNIVATKVNGNNDLNALFEAFMREELGAMWLTEKNDYVSAHLPQPVVSSANPTPLRGVIDVYDSLSTNPRPADHIAQPSNNADPASSLPPVGGDGHAYIKTIEHGYLDSEILKRIYKRTNINTALGKKIADLMRAQGLGQYMQRTRTNYIGDTDVLLKVESVVSQSDTFKEGGAMLGERAGKGVGYKSGEKKLFYKTDCLGYWICLDCITCDAGYSQAEDMTHANIWRDQNYQPDYDGLGLVLDPKSVINGQRNEGFGGIATTNRDKLSMSSQPFGFAPRYNEYKVGRSNLSGGFALRSMRRSFIGYNMDKLVYPDEFFTQDVTDLDLTIQAPFYPGPKFHKFQR